MEDPYGLGNMYKRWKDVKGGEKRERRERRGKRGGYTLFDHDIYSEALLEEDRQQKRRAKAFPEDTMDPKIFGGVAHGGIPKKFWKKNPNISLDDGSLCAPEINDAMRCFSSVEEDEGEKDFGMMHDGVCRDETEALLACMAKHRENIKSKRAGKKWSFRHRLSQSNFNGRSK